MNKIKLLHVQVLPKLSGVQKVSLDILSNLSSEYDKHILFGSGCPRDENLIEQLEKSGVTVHYIDSIRREIGVHDISALLSTYWFIRRHKFDIVHTNSSKPAIIGRLAAYMARTSLIVHSIHGIAFHDSESYFKRKLFYFLDRFSANFGDVLISVNNYYLDFFEGIENKLCIHNGIDFKDTLDFKYKQRDISNSIFNVGFMSRFDNQKDPITLLKAIKYIVDEGYIKRSDLCLHLAGSGELDDEVKYYLKENSLVDVVKVYGWVSDQEDFLEKIDIFCLPSIYEAFGLVVLEAALFGVPTIGSRVEGLPEVIVDKETGLLFNPRDYKQLAEKIVYYYENPDIVSCHGMNAKNRVREKFSMQRMVSKYEEIYEKSKAPSL